MKHGTGHCSENSPSPSSSKSSCVSTDSEGSQQEHLAVTPWSIPIIPRILNGFNLAIESPRFVDYPIRISVLQPGLPVTELTGMILEVYPFPNSLTDASFKRVDRTQPTTSGNSNSSGAARVCELEHGHLVRWFTHLKKMPCSIVMLVYQSISGSGRPWIQWTGHD